METDMTKGRPLPIILRFILPLLIGNVFQQLYNMADTIIVGRYVSADALAAVGSTGTIMFLLTGLAQGLTTGFSVLTSQTYGAKNAAKLRQSVANGIILSVFCSILITITGFLTLPPLLHLMNTPANIYQDAYTYIMLICAGTIATIFYNLSSSYLRAVGNSRIPLFFLVFSAGLNVLLDLLFILKFHMGVAGAAIATDIAQGISAILCLIYIYHKVHILRPNRNDWHLNRAATIHQLKVGIPMALQFAITASGTMVMQSAINLFGSSAVAAYTAATKLQNLLTQGMTSMGQVMATYGGQNYGKNDLKRIRSGVRSALLLSVAYSLLAAALCYFLLPYTLDLFFSKGENLAELLPWAAQYLHLCILFYIPLSFIFVFRNIMQGCGYGFLPMLGGVVEFFARLFVAVIAMHSLNYILACACDPAAWVSAAVFTGISYLFVRRKMDQTMAPK